MLKRLFGFLHQPPSTPAPVEEQQQQVEPPRDPAALADFVRLITRHLGAATSEALLREVLNSDEELPYALQFDSYGDGDIRVMIDVDWKACDEVEWQADMLLAARGIGPRWAWEMPEDRHKRTVINALKSLERWLRPHGLAMLHIDSGGDDYQVFFIERDQADRAIALGVAAGLEICSHRDFLIRQQDDDAEPGQAAPPDQPAR